MTAVSVKIGRRYESLSDDDITRIEDAFEEFTLTEESREEFIIRHTRPDVDLSKYPVAFELDKITFAISRNLNALIENKNMKQIEAKLKEVIRDLQNACPEKNWKIGVLRELHKFEARRSTQQFFSDPKRWWPFVAIAGGIIFLLTRLL